jgi:hypothetical protein
VQALGELVKPDGTGEKLHARQRVLNEVAVQAGQETDDERRCEEPAKGYRGAGITGRRLKRLTKSVQQSLHVVLPSRRFDTAVPHYSEPSGFSLGGSPAAAPLI